MNKDSKIIVFGQTGLVGSAITRRLQSDGYNNVVKFPYRFDLRDQLGVNVLFSRFEPEYVFLVAATVGGVKANNTRRAEFIYDNTMIQSNVINAAHTYGVKKLLFTGSSCIYPRNNPQPITEDSLLKGELEPTNEPYAIAKINGIKMCQAYHDQYGCNFISVMPSNLYGYNDKYDLDNCHVLPALLRKIIIAKERGEQTVEIWGTGAPLREFLFVDDLADACLFLMNNYDSPEIINIGTGKEISIRDLAELIRRLIGWNGDFVYNGKLDGIMKKTLDVSKINALGWYAENDLIDGIEKTAIDIYKSEKYLEWLK